MLLDNPFFVRDIRMLGRREFAALCRWIGYQSVALAAPLFLLERIPWDLDPLRVPLGVGALVMVHWFSCLVSGLAAGSRMFLVEHQKRTLESVLLISRSPWRWVPEKLLYSLYAVLLVWLAGLPFYWAVLLRGHAPATPFLAASAFPLLAGVVGICHALLVSPEAWPNYPAERKRHPFGRWLEEGLPPLWVEIQLFWHVTGRVLPAVLNPMAQPGRVTLFGYSLDGDLLVLLQTALLGAGALGTAWWIANPGSPVAASLARVLRVGGMLGLYALLVGSLWPRLPLHERVLWTAGLPALWLAFNRPARKGARKPEDPLAAGDVERLQRWWDNPLFVRDTRALLRSENLLRATIRSTIEFAAVPLALAGLTLLLPGPPVRSPAQTVLERAGVIAAVLGPGFLFATGLFFAVRARRLWDAERNLQTLPQLLGVPLTARDLVIGRWAACATAALPSFVGALGVCAMGLMCLAGLRPEGVPPYLLILLFGLSFGVGIGAGAANVPFPKMRAWQVSLAIPYVVGPLLCVPTTISAIFDLGDRFDGLMLLVLGCVVMYLALCGGFYVASLRNIEWLRAREPGDH